jgi:tRNA 5-methylaminomethyl-2-thiouridine biosynthesis bifunctional protein
MRKPWFKIPDAVPSGSHIAIIGGGIGGVTALDHLLKAGYKVTLIEKSDYLLSAASGNPAAILDPYISLGETNEKSFYLKAYQYALQYYKNLGEDIFIPCGLSKIAKNEQELNRFKKLAPQYSNDLMSIDKDKLIFPKSGYVIPKHLSARFEESANILLNTAVTEINLNDDNSWSLFTSDKIQILKVDAVILSNSYNVENLKQTEHLKLDKVAGQISYISPEYSDNSILCSNTYLTPKVMTPAGEANICGATFEKNGTLDITDAAHNKNLENAPYRFSNPDILGGRRAIRAISHDHLPLCGPVADYKKYLSGYDTLHHGPGHKSFADASYHPNLFVCAGLGARGFLSAPILGKYLASMVGGNELPFEEKICHAIHPARFIIRNLSKK